MFVFGTPTICSWRWCFVANYWKSRIVPESEKENGSSNPREDIYTGVDITPTTIILTESTENFDEASAEKSSVSVEAEITDQISDYNEITVYVKAPSYNQSRGIQVTLTPEDLFIVKVR